MPISNSEKAEANYKEAIKLYKDTGDENKLADTLKEYGDFLKNNGRQIEADTVYQEAETTYRKNGDKNNLAGTLRTHGNMCACMEKFENDNALTSAPDISIDYVQRIEPIQNYNYNNPKTVINRYMPETYENFSSNINNYCDEHRESLQEWYKLSKPITDYNNIKNSDKKAKMKKSNYILLTANGIEANVINKELCKYFNCKMLNRIIKKGVIYDFVPGTKILHIHPPQTSSFTRYGSFSTIRDVLSKKKIEVIFSVGVAFGISSKKLKIGDVVISNSIMPYDTYNKINDGANLELLNTEFRETDRNLISRICDLTNDRKHLINEKGYDFEWHRGCVLSGGTVLSNEFWKDKIVSSAECITRDIIAGEMEAIGVYMACSNAKVKCITIKGICDWGVEKNTFEETYGLETTNDVKDAIQANAARNSIIATLYLLEKRISGGDYAPYK